MNFPPEIEIFGLEDFATAGSRAGGGHSVELLAQARPNGRCLDHFRVTLGGSRILDVTVPMAQLINSPVAARWTMKFQTWPRDVEIRRNMTTEKWTDISTFLRANDAMVQDEDGEELPTVDVINEMARLKKGAAFRFGVFIAEDYSLQLGLQGMPASADHLMAKPAFRG